MSEGFANTKEHEESKEKMNDKKKAKNIQRKKKISTR